MISSHPELLHCRVCPQNCGVNRYEATGFCGAGASIKVNSAHLHHGEEPVLSGTGGSGTIFLSYCNLRCVFCQNHQISHLGWGSEISEEDCAGMMLRLQEAGAHNVNLVSPTQYTPQLATAIKLARAGGLSIPVVWNSNAYETVESLQTLAGLVDIYLPDLKYAHPAYSLTYSQARDYPAISLKAVQVMQSQVGKFVISNSGLALRGLLVRHLVLPNRLAGTRDLLYTLRETLGEGVSLSLMAQYYPTAAAQNIPELARGLHPEEYAEALDLAMNLGFTDVYAQELDPSPDWTPAFSPEKSGPDEPITHFHGKTHNAK